MRKYILVSIFSLCLTACASTHQQPSSTSASPKLDLADTSYLEQGKRDFQEGFYKRALQELLPVAADGNGEAQYAVGYMYYYGYGVSQDTNVGFFWIQRAAGQHYVPAIQALRSIQQNRTEHHRAYPSKLG